jgi:hypothetical protein
MQRNPTHRRSYGTGGRQNRCGWCLAREAAASPVRLTPSPVMRPGARIAGKVRSRVSQLLGCSWRARCASCGALSAAPSCEDVVDQLAGVLMRVSSIAPARPSSSAARERPRRSRWALPRNSLGRQAAGLAAPPDASPPAAPQLPAGSVWDPSTRSPCRLAAPRPSRRTRQTAHAEHEQPASAHHETSCRPDTQPGSSSHRSPHHQQRPAKCGPRSASAGSALERRSRSSARRYRTAGSPASRRRPDEPEKRASAVCAESQPSVHSIFGGIEARLTRGGIADKGGVAAIAAKGRCTPGGAVAAVDRLVDEPRDLGLRRTATV